MKKLLKSAVLTSAMVLSVCSTAFAAPSGNITDIDNTAILYLKDCDNAFVTQVITDVNVVNNIDIGVNVDTSELCKPQQSGSRTQEVLQRSRGIRAGLGVR